MPKFIIALVFVFFTVTCIAGAADDDIFEIETEGSCLVAPGASVDLAKTIAFFNARRRAVDVAGRYLSRKNLIETYELNRDEIYSLAAREIHAELIEEHQERTGNETTYRLRILSRVQASDFVKAELEDNRQKKKELKESYLEEMEQPITAEIDPGMDIAKAYRLLREKKWRITMIYLNHLQKKYPNWDRIYMAKALIHYLLHEPEFMEKALIEACRLKNTAACDDLKNIKKLHDYDFGLSPY
jgi:hypothetical protein